MSTAIALVVFLAVTVPLSYWIGAVAFARTHGRGHPGCPVVDQAMRQAKRLRGKVPALAAAQFVAMLVMHHGFHVGQAVVFAAYLLVWRLTRRDDDDEDKRKKPSRIAGIVALVRGRLAIVPG